MTCRLTQKLQVALFIHSSLAETGKCRISVQFYHSETAPDSHCGAHRMREMSRSVCCKHLFSSPISTSNKGSNIADPPFSAFSICITAAQPCSSTHRTKERPFFVSSLVLSTWVHTNSCFIIHQKMVLETIDVNAYSKYWQEALPRHCQHLSLNMFRSCLPTTVKSCQIMWSDARAQLLSPHSTPGQSHVLDGSGCQPAIQATCLYWW